MSKGVRERLTAKSGANAAGSLSTATGTPRRLVMVTVKYSASPTQAGVTVTLDSGAGTDYDAVLSTGSANAQNNVYIPANDLVIMSDDVIKVDAPAGGESITSAISIYTEKVNF